MSISELKAKAIPYYACYIAQKILFNESATTLSLRDDSWFSGDDEDAAQYLLNDYELVSAALKFLEERDILQFIQDEFGPDIVARNGAHKDAVRKLSDEPGTVFAKFKLAGEGRHYWLRSALISINSRLENYEASVAQESSSLDKWAPIPLDHEDKAQIAAIATLEKVAEALRTDNGYSSEHPGEKAFVQDKLSAAIKRLKEDAEISTMYVNEFALKPLSILVKRFGTAAIGVGAATAKDTIQSWLKSKGIQMLNEFLK
jgi:hypothetical protein